MQGGGRSLENNGLSLHGLSEAAWWLGALALGGGLK